MSEQGQALFCLYSAGLVGSGLYGYFRRWNFLGYSVSVEYRERHYADWVRFRTTKAVRTVEYLNSAACLMSGVLHVMMQENCFVLP